MTRAPDSLAPSWLPRQQRVLRQVEPGTRLKPGSRFYLNKPVPDDEAVAHVLLEPVPRNGEALSALIDKYMAQESSQ